MEDYTALNQDEKPKRRGELVVFPAPCYLAAVVDFFTTRKAR